MLCALPDRVGWHGSETDCTQLKSVAMQLQLANPVMNVGEAVVSCGHTFTLFGIYLDVLTHILLPCSLDGRPLIAH